MTVVSGDPVDVEKTAQAAAAEEHEGSQHLKDVSNLTHETL